MSNLNEIDQINKELKQLTKEINIYNKSNNEDLSGHGDILEARRIYLISKAERILKENTATTLRLVK
jgi:hypothetical protein